MNTASTRVDVAASGPGTLVPAFTGVAPFVPVLEYKGVVTLVYNSVLGSIMPPGLSTVMASTLITGPGGARRMHVTRHVTGLPAMSGTYFY